MADPLLESSALSAFCGSVATMMSAGMQLDEAVYMLAENRESSHFKRVCEQIYLHIINGEKLSSAMIATGAFPKFSIDMVETGECAGRLEPTLRNLSIYYGEEDRTFQKIRSSVTYPAALLSIMAIILAVTVIVILPVFTNVYTTMAGSLTAGSSGMVTASAIIGWASLAVTIICAIAAIYLAVQSRSQKGRERVLEIFEKLPATKTAMYQLALSRFTAALATYLSTGMDSEHSLARAIEAVHHKKLKKRLERVYGAMVDVDEPRSFQQAIAEYEVFEPLYARMLSVGMRSGSIDSVLMDLSSMFFEDSSLQLDRLIDRIEPILAALLTVAVGATLISIMLPLIGIMGSIG